MIANGELRARKFGRAWAVDPASVNERLAAKPDRGRPLGPSSAWRVLCQELPGLLDFEDLPRIAVQARRRAVEHRFRVLPFKLDAVRSDPDVVLSGAAGAAERGAAVAVGEVDVYVRQSSLDEVIKRHDLRASPDEANVIVRVVDDDAWPFEDHERVAPLVVCALDAFERLDRRAAHEALAQARS